MSAEVKKSYASTLILIALGMLALCVGTKWLMLLVPAAIVAWYSASGGTLKRNRS